MKKLTPSEVVEQLRSIANTIEFEARQSEETAAIEHEVIVSQCDAKRTNYGNLKVDINMIVRKKI